MELHIESANITFTHLNIHTPTPRHIIHSKSNLTILILSRNAKSFPNPIYYLTISQEEVSQTITIHTYI